MKKIIIDFTLQALRTVSIEGQRLPLEVLAKFVFEQL